MTRGQGSPGPVRGEQTRPQECHEIALRHGDTSTSPTLNHVRKNGILYFSAIWKQKGDAYDLNDGTDCMDVRVGGILSITVLPLCSGSTERHVISGTANNPLRPAVGSSRSCCRPS